MKTQRRILERAKQGDPEAIACLANRCLGHEGITATVDRENDGLRILLESAQVPDQEAVLPRIHDYLARLDVTPKTVKVYGKQLGKATPDWESTLELAPIQNSLTPNRGGFAADDSTESIAHPTRELANALSQNPLLQSGRSPQSHRFMFTGMVTIGALIALNLVLGFRSMFRLRSESESYVNAALPEIVAAWDIHELVDRASPEFLQANSQPQLQQTFTQLSQQLGKLEQYQSAACKVNPLAAESLTVSDCHATLVFEKASAAIEIQLVRHDRQWQIYRFYTVPNLPSSP